MSRKTPPPNVFGCSSLKLYIKKYRSDKFKPVWKNIGQCRFKFDQIMIRRGRAYQNWKCVPLKFILIEKFKTRVKSYLKEQLKS